MLDDYDFIAKHEGNLHVEQDGVTNALLVLNAKTGEGILVNSEGSAYARYSAYLPFAGHILLSFSLSHFLLSNAFKVLFPLYILTIGAT